MQYQFELDFFYKISKLIIFLLHFKCRFNLMKFLESIILIKFIKKLYF